MHNKALEEKLNDRLKDEDPAGRKKAKPTATVRNVEMGIGGRLLILLWVGEICSLWRTSQRGLFAIAQGLQRNNKGQVQKRMAMLIPVLRSSSSSNWIRRRRRR